MALDRARIARDAGREQDPVVIAALRKVVERGNASVTIDEVLRHELKRTQDEDAMTTACIVRRFWLEAQLDEMTSPGTGPPYRKGERPKDPDSVTRLVGAPVSRTSLADIESRTRKTVAPEPHHDVTSMRLRGTNPMPHSFDPERTPDMEEDEGAQDMQ